MSEFTPKQQKFIQEYLVDLNGTQAAIRAGYSEKTAGSIANTLLMKVEIQEAVAARREALSKKTEVTIERVIREYARVAFVDIRKLYDENGYLLSVNDIDDDSAGAIASIESEQLYEFEDGEKKPIGLTKKIRFTDKVRALDSLAKHLGMFIDKTEITGKDGGPVDTRGTFAFPPLQILIESPSNSTLGETGHGPDDGSE